MNRRTFLAHAGAFALLTGCTPRCTWGSGIWTTPAPPPEPSTWTPPVSTWADATWSSPPSDEQWTLSSTPVIISTDLNHPNGDPDDHIDLAVAAGLGLDVRAVILDRQPHLYGGSGAAPMAQLNAITGLDWPAYDGLELGGSGTALISILEAQEQPVVILVLGSCRDVADAIRLDPELVATRVSRIVVFAGDASAEYVEMNVGLDPAAFLTVMTGPVPVRWVPCFDGGVWQAGTRSSFVQVAMKDLFVADLDDHLTRFFAYRFHESTADPLTWIDGPVTAADRQVLAAGQRNLWAAGLIGPALADGVVRWAGDVVARFVPMDVALDPDGTTAPLGPPTARVDVFTVENPNRWQDAMLGSTVTALRQI